MSISLNDHEQRLKSIDTTLPSITNRITALENKPSGYDCVVVSFGASTTVDSKYSDYNMAVISFSAHYNQDNISISAGNSKTISNGTRVVTGTWATRSFGLVKSGTSIKVTGYNTSNGRPPSVTVLLYKQLTKTL